MMMDSLLAALQRRPLHLISEKQAGNGRVEEI